MPNDIDYMAMAYARDPVKNAHLKPQIDAAVKREQEVSQATASRQAWYEAHKACPSCESTAVAQSYVGVMPILGEPFVGDEVNDAWCSCGWSGKVMDLVPPSRPEQGGVVSAP